MSLPSPAGTNPISLCALSRSRNGRTTANQAATDSAATSRSAAITAKSDRLRRFCAIASATVAGCVETTTHGVPSTGA